MKKVLILLSTYNGEKYLNEQLESIFKQINVEVSVLARDDGSSDSTTEILESWSTSHNLSWYSGDNLKPAKSFLNLIKKASGYDYYALCDQDDYWCEDKLFSAVSMLEENKAELYYSSTTLVDEKLNKIKQIKYPNIDYTLFQSIMYNHISGCTMVFSDGLKRMISLFEPEYLPMHDWWIILVCKALGMRTVYDFQSHILYRQHGNNTVGLGKGSIIKYWMHCAFKRERKISSMVNEIIRGYHEYLDYENFEELQIIANSNNNLKDRFKLLSDKRFRIESVYRMPKETIGFRILVIFKNL